MGTVSRVHTFSSGAVLTAAQLNGEFDNLLTSSAINGGLNATNLGVTAGLVAASKAVVVDGSRNLDDGTTTNQINNLVLSGTLTVAGATTQTGALSIDDTTDSTSTTTGSIHTDGGVGIALDLIVGNDVKVGGGYGATGATISTAGVGQFNGALTTDGVLTGASLVCTAAGTFGGGYGATGATISTAGVIQANGAITSDGAVTGATLAGTISTAAQNSITSASSLATVGTITSGTWSGVIDGSATMTLGSDATGDIYYRDASGFLERLASGADGTVLTGTGAGVIPAWESPAVGDITSVVAGAGMTGGGTTGDVTLNVIGGNGITANADDVAITAAQTAVTSIYNASLKMGRDSQNLIDFATADDKIILRVANVNEVELVANTLQPTTSDGVALGTGSLMWSDLFLASGSVINFNNGDITLTHSLNTLTVAGGTLAASAITLGGTALGSLYSPIAGSSSIATVGTVGTGTWQGTKVASAYLDDQTAHLNITQSFTGAKTFGAATQFNSTVTVGVDDAGYDVKFFGASAGAYMEYDFSADQLRILGPSADAAGSSGKLLLATAQVAVASGDILGQIDFQAPLETQGGDGALVSAAIKAVAQDTFTATVNKTDLIFYTGSSEEAAEKFRFTSDGELGVGGANYGTDGQVLTSAGAGAAVAWESVSAGVSLSGSTNNTIATVTGANALIGEANLTFDGTNLVQYSNGNNPYFRIGDDASNYAQLGFDSTNNTLNFTGASGGGGKNSFMVNDTSNSFMSYGITINQGAFDNEILALKSSDVAHGITTLTETDTYCAITKYLATTGGVKIAGYGESDTGIILHGTGTTNNTAKTTSAAGSVELQAALKSGTTQGALGADANIVVFNSHGGGARFIFDTEGTGHADVAWTTYDTYDDLTLISDMEDTLLAMETPDQTPRRHAMEATGIIGKGSWHMEDGKPRAMVNFTKLAMLHHGALIQTGDRFKMLEDRLEATEAKLLLAQSKLDKLEIN
jgi:hypothetical protein